MFSSVVLHMFNSHLPDHTPGKNSVAMARDRRVVVAGFTMLHAKTLTGRGATTSELVLDLPGGLLQPLGTLGAGKWAGPASIQILYPIIKIAPP